MIKDFEHSNTAKENQTLREQAEQLAKENAKLEKNCKTYNASCRRQDFMTSQSLRFMKKTSAGQAAAHRDGWKESMYNDR